MADVATLVIEVTTDQVRDAVTELKNLASGAQQAEDRTMSLKDAVIGLGTAWATAKIAEATAEIAKLGMRYEMLGATMGVMANNAGISRAEMEDLQTAMMKTGISALQARQGLQVMAAAEVDLSKASDLARVAQDAATLAGINSSEAFNNLVRGVATGESRIIRHMGIMVNFKQSINEWADANHRSVKSLTATEMAQIRMTAALEEGKKRLGVYEEAMGTAGKQLLSMQRYTEDLKVSIGEAFNPALNAIIFELVGDMKSLKETIAGLKDSGEFQQFASQLRHAVIDTIESLKSVARFIWDHADAIKMLAATYASFKTAQYVVELGKAAAALWAKAMMAQRAARVEALAQEEMARAAVIEALAEEEANEARIRAMGTQFKTKAVYEEIAASRIAAANAVAVAEGRAAAAGEAAAAAGSLAGRSATTFGSALTAAGGPILAFVTLLGMAVAAWHLFKDKSEDNAEAAAKAVDDEIKRAMDHSYNLQKVLRYMRMGLSEADATKAAYDPDQDPVIKNLRAATAEREAALEGVKNGLGRNNVFKDEAGQYRTNLSGAEADFGASELNRIQKQIDDYRAKMESFRNWKKIEMSLSDEQEKERIAAAKKRKDEETGHEREARESDFFSNERRKILKEMEQANSEGLGLSKELRAEAKAEREYKAELLLIDEKSKKNTEGVITVTTEHAEKLRELARAARDAKIAAAERVEELETAKHKEKVYMKVLDDYTSRINALAQQNSEWGKSAREIAELRANSLGISKEEVAVIKELTDAEARELEIKQQHAEIDRLVSEGKSLNKRKADEEEGLQRLDDINKAMAAKGIKMLPGVYARAWAEIVMKGNDALSLLVNGTKIATDQMGDMFYKLATTGKASFKDMINSILNDMARLAANKAAAALFQSAIGAMAGWFGNPNPTPAASNVSNGPIGDSWNQYTSSNVVGNSEKGGTQTSIVINMNSNGAGTTDVKSNVDGAKELGGMVEALVAQFMSKQMRSNGMLARS